MKSQASPERRQHVDAVVVKLEIGWHVGLEAVHAVPALQHFRLAPLPHCVFPDGQPQMPLTRSAQATPLTQQLRPHTAWPA